MKTLYALIATTMLTACGSMSSYVQSAALERYVAQDVTARLSADYPAANTLFVFDGSDPFSKDLSQALREKGFAVADSVPANTAANIFQLIKPAKPGNWILPDTSGLSTPMVSRMMPA